MKIRHGGLILYILIFKGENDWIWKAIVAFGAEFSSKFVMKTYKGNDTVPDYPPQSCGLRCRLTFKHKCDLHIKSLPWTLPSSENS